MQTNNQGEYKHCFVQLHVGITGEPLKQSDTDWHQSNFFLFYSDVPTMPIVDKLKEALKPGRKETGDEGDLNKLLASSAKKVLLQKIEFEPASKGFSYQLDSLKNKYVILNPRNEGASCQKATEPAQIKRQGRKNAKWTGNLANFDRFVVIFPYLPFQLRKCSSSKIRIISQNFLHCFFSFRKCGWQPEWWDPRPAKDALSGEQAYPQMGAGVQGGSRPP